MKIIEVPHDIDLAVSASKRAPGVHMSDLYNSLYKVLEPGRYNAGTPMDLRRLELGMALETILEEGLKHRLAQRPGEFTIQIAGTPVHYNPDLFILEDVFRIGEIKYTSMSSRQGITHNKFNKWFTQMKLYCHATETPFARLYAFFSNGDWTMLPNIGYTPQLRAFDIEFTPRELRDEWATILQHGVDTRLLRG